MPICWTSVIAIPTAVPSPKGTTLAERTSLSARVQLSNWAMCVCSSASDGRSFLWRNQRHFVAALRRGWWAPLAKGDQENEGSAVAGCQTYKKHQKDWERYAFLQCKLQVLWYAPNVSKAYSKALRFEWGLLLLASLPFTLAQRKGMQLSLGRE